MGGGYSSWRKKFTTSFGGRGPLNLRIINAVQTLQVDVGHSRYPISIGPGLLANRELLEARIRSRDLLIVTNTTVARLYLATLTGSLAGKRVAECILPDGEQHKTLQTAGWVFDALVAKKMNRDAAVLALGGGVIGDIAGFAAAGLENQARREFEGRARSLWIRTGLEQAFALRQELRTMATPDTIVCRCEDVPLERMRAHPVWRTAKLQTRCGMGPCQGRICGPAAEFLLGWKQESVRPPIFPVPVDHLSR